MDTDNKLNIEAIPFGIKEVDEATNINGIPRGRTVELFGPESGGKSYLTLKLIASAQKQGLRAGLIDLEHSFVEDWAADQGVDVDNLLYGCDFDYGEQALEYINEICVAGLVGVLVVDSTAALIPKAEIEGDIEDQRPGLLAAIMSKAVKKIMDSSSKTNTTVIWINQVREKISMGGKPMWGDSETTPGGRALKFYSHMRIKVQRIGKVFEKGATEDSKKVIATRSLVKIMKNKVAAPFGEAEFEIPFKKEASNPIVLLVKTAYEVKAISRKKMGEEGDEKMIYVFGKGKDQIVTDCSDFLSLADWFVKNNKVLDLIQVTKEKALEREVEVHEDILKLELSKDFISPIMESASVGDKQEVAEKQEEIVPEDK